MITECRVQNFKALRDVTLKLTPIHVLIGPNDSGKTSVLQAIEALSRSVDYRLNEAFPGDWEGRELAWRHSDVAAYLKFEATLKPYRQQRPVPKTPPSEHE
jgi:AAA15 family ATPase/GTPase